MAACNSLLKTCRKNSRISMGKGGGKDLRFLFGVVVLVTVLLLMIVGIVANRATETTRSVTVSSAGEFKDWEFVAEMKLNSRKHFHFNYVSKRRVPNGPDPIHNRRASMSRQPPGRI